MRWQTSWHWISPACPEEISSSLKGNGPRALQAWQEAVEKENADKDEERPKGQRGGRRRRA